MNATQEGSWAAITRMSDVGVVAAAELGVDLERLAPIPDPGHEVAAVLSALIDGFDRTLVAAAVARAPSYKWTAPLPDGPVAQSFRARIAMRRPGQRCVHADAVDLTQ